MKLKDQRDQYITSLAATGRSPKTIHCYQQRIDQLITYLTRTFYPLASIEDIDPKSSPST
jgi:hypothetical protein